jgi:hypothetical protein
MLSAEITITLSGRALDGSAGRAGFVLLGAFLLSFGFIRMSARLMRSPKVPWWPGSVTTEGGLHVHHLVFGIVLLLLTGFITIALDPASPWAEVLAAGFGVGAGLTLDEFALWLHLEDVYWSEEGRRSIDAVIMATILAGLVLLGGSPLRPEDTGSTIGIVVTVLLVLGFATVAMLKGKTVLGVAGVLVPLFGLVGAIRLAKPNSPWARWRYPPEGRRMARAIRRHERHSRRYRRWQNRIGGEPSVGPPAEGR